MRTSTLFTPRELPEAELAAVLDREFDAAWFPDYHRYSIDSDDAVVFVDVEPGYVGRLSPDERHALAGQLGFVPHGALHVSASSNYVGSPELAGRVLDTLHRLLGARASAA